MSSPQAPTVLIFTYPEYGQSNVNLATSYELALAGVNVYISSFASLSGRVTRLQELIDRHASRSIGQTTGSVIFRECKGVISFAEAARRLGINATSAIHPPGVSGALEGYTKVELALFPWSSEEYLTVVKACEEIITTIKPNVVVVDTYGRISAHLFYREKNSRREILQTIAKF
ncbi:hypothetical protein V8E55_007152 [Tylopilus felleus]